jgi:hypothetical protein
MLVCNDCNRQYNERMLSSFNRLKVKNEIVFFDLELCEAEKGQIAESYQKV